MTLIDFNHLTEYHCGLEYNFFFENDNLISSIASTIEYFGKKPVFNNFVESKLYDLESLSFLICILQSIFF